MTIPTVAFLGLPGPQGQAAYTVTTAPFTQPASSSSVTVSVTSTAWMAAGEVVFVAGGGYYSVAALPSNTSVSLTNLGYPGNAAPSSVIPTGNSVSAGGLQGPTGATGATGPTGPAGPAPSGTGDVHVTGGALDTTAGPPTVLGAANTVLQTNAGATARAWALVADANVATGAAIQGSKVALATGTGFPHITSGAVDAAARAVNLAAADVTGTLPLANEGAPTGTGLPHVVAGAWSAAASLIVNADVDPAAAIAGSKLALATGTGFAHVTSGAVDAAARAVNLGTADITGTLPLANEGAPTGTGIPHVVAGAWSAATSLIVNADVDPAANIAGTKVAYSDTAPLLGASTEQAGIDALKALTWRVLSVANLASLGAVASGMPEGVLGYVISVKRYYKLSRSDTQTADGKTIVAATGGGNWLQELSVGDSGWLTQTAWGINPSTGNDENVGSVASPLATINEFMRRMKIASILQPMAVAMSVTIVGDLPSTDILDLDTDIANEIDIIGTPTTQGVASTFTAVTTRSRTAPGTQWQVADTNNGSTNFVAGNVGFQLFDSTANAVAWIDSVSGNTATLSESMGPVAAGGFPIFTPPEVALVNGDSYTIRRPSQLWLGTIRPKATSPNVAVIPSIRFFNLWFPNSSGFLRAYPDDLAYIKFEQCRFSRNCSAGGFHLSQVFFNNCIFDSGAGPSCQDGSQINIYGGLFKGTIFINRSILVIDGDPILRGNIQFTPSGVCVIGNVGSFGQSSVFVFSTNGRGEIRHTPSGNYSSQVMWGNPTTYCSAGPGAVITYRSGQLTTTFGQLPTTATVSFGGNTGVNSPVWSPTTNAFLSPPAGGMTMANLTGNGAGQYNGFAFDPATASSFASS